MTITEEHILAICPQAASNVRNNKNLDGVKLCTIVDLMNKYADDFGITTPLRWAHYLAQVLHESGGFKYSEEIASGKAYEGRKDLGNTHVGDGAKYKGRGFIQLTGRSNYQKYKIFCGYDVIAKPELLCKPVGAIRSSMWFWHTAGLSYHADRDAFEKITRRINGGTNGIENRLRFLKRAKKAFNID